jgi:type I thyroxine 5'-deiodinase
MYQHYRDAATFYVVYIEEAHPIDLWQQSSNVKDGVLFKSPRTNEERIDVAAACIVRLAVKIPALLDGIDNRIERAYTGWPDRLYIVATDGRIYYKSAPGPFGFSTKELEASLTQLLPSSRVTAR